MVLACFAKYQSTRRMITFTVPKDRLILQTLMKKPLQKRHVTNIVASNILQNIMSATAYLMLQGDHFKRIFFSMLLICYDLDM